MLTPLLLSRCATLCVYSIFALPLDVRRKQWMTQFYIISKMKILYGYFNGLICFLRYVMKPREELEMVIRVQTEIR